MAKTELKTKKKKDEIQSGSDLRISAIRHKIGELERLVDSTTGTEEQITELKNELQHKIAEFAFTTKLHDSFKEEHLPAWLQRPYALFKDRSKENEWILAVPRFLDFQLGWLEDQDEAWNYFRINRYIDFLIELPDYLKEALGIRRIELPLKLEGQILVTDPLFDEKLTLRYGKYLLQKIEPGKYRINPKMHLDLVANMIRDGILPYSPSPMDEADISDRKPPFKLEPWQERAWDAFRKYGNIGLYWPTGGGKSRFMQWLVTRLKGPHLIFVHSATLREQWQNAMNEFGVPPSEYQIVTYQSIRRIYSEMSKTKNPFTLLIFEEHHHLPADTFSLASLIPSKYRIGGTASPFREDHREDLIFALTGVPQGLSWSEFLQFGVIHKPEVHLYIVKTVEDKLVLADNIVRSKNEKTIVFVFRLAIGRKVASLLDAPFLSGETPPSERIAKAKTEKVVVMSAVGSEGLSIQNLQRVVEVDFLFGSRTEEVQRLGRLLHSDFKGEHHVLMTEEEYGKYKKRLYPILEKGYDIIVHHAGRYETFVGTAIESPKLESPRERSVRFRAEPTRAPAARRNQRREPAATTETPTMPGLSSVSSLPGVQKLLSQLTAVQQKCVKVMLDRDKEFFTVKKLSLYTGYSVGSLQNALGLNELLKKGLIERGKERGEFRVNLDELPKRLGL